MASGCGQIQVVQVRGELDLALADSLAARGYAAIGRQARVLLLDVAGVSFCDARGLSALVRIANHADRTGCRYGLIAPQPLVVRILRITGLDQRLPVFTSVNEAAIALRSDTRTAQRNQTMSGQPHPSWTPATPAQRQEHPSGDRAKGGSHDGW
jgi:anti-anti-sigma factor